MITAILLAAGESKRFPGNKLLFKIKKGETILGCILKSLLNSQVNRSIIVLGYEAEKLLPIVKKLNNGTISIAMNLDHKKGGMSSSIRKGMEVALGQSSNRLDAVIITPADIPLIPTEIFNRLIEFYRYNEPKLIIPTYNNKKGHPILISSELFSNIQKVSEINKGLKEIIRTFEKEIVYLPTNTPEILKDVDTYEDLQQL